MEARRCPRFETRCGVSFSGDHTQGTGEVVNLSLGGCAVESAVGVPKGAFLRLEMSFSDQGGPMFVELAPVRWSHGNRFGAEFVDMELRDRQRLRQYVESLGAHATFLARSGAPGWGPLMEQRGYPRFPVEFPISFSDENLAGDGTVIDLSKNGLKLTVSSTQQVLMGKYLKLRLTLPDQHPPLKVASAAVRWSRGRLFGLELLYLEPEGSDRLEQFMGTLQTRPSH